MSRSLTSPNRHQQQQQPHHQQQHCPLEFATKTSYRAPLPLSPIPYAQNSPTAPRLIHVSLIARHGTRNPTNNSIIRMTQLEQWLHTNITPTPHWLTHWTSILQQYRSAPGALTSHGHVELSSIGYRFAALYASQLQHVGATVRIRSSYKERAVSSAQAFRQGYIAACESLSLQHRITSLRHHSKQLHPDPPHAHRPVTFPPPSSSSHCESDSSLPSDTDSTEDADLPAPLPSTIPNEANDLSHLPVEVLPLGRDAILRYFERNEAYATFALNHKARTLQDLSRGSFRRYTADMARRMTDAFASSIPLDIDLVRSVAEAAAFDAAHGRADVSLFCNTLTADDARVLETFELRHRPFYKAHERFQNASAPLVQDLVHSLQASVNRSLHPAVSDPTAYAADLRFAHAETLVPLLLLLDIQSNGLSPTNPKYQKGLAAMSPFAANLALELYESPPTDPSQSPIHFVRFRLNERYVESIPALGEHGRTGVVQLNHLLDFFNNVLADGQ